MLKRTTLTQIALLLAIGVSASPAVAQNTVSTGATTSIIEAGSVRVINDTSLQALLATGTIAPTGVTFTMAAPAVGGAASLGMPGFVSGGGEAIAMTSSGLITGTTINGEALSVSVGGSFSNLQGDSNTGANGGISVVIAQYN